MSSLLSKFHPRKVAFVALTVVLLLVATPVHAQEGIEELPEATDTMISFTSDSQDTCARGRTTHPWMFVARTHGQWVQFNWEPETADCFMDLLFQTSNSDVFFFSHLQRGHDDVTCAGSSQGRITCSALGSVGSTWVRVRIEARNLGDETLSIYEAGSGVVRLYDISVLPNFLWLAPFAVR